MGPLRVIASMAASGGGAPGGDIIGPCLGGAAPGGLLDIDRR